MLSERSQQPARTAMSMISRLPTLLMSGCVLTASGARFQAPSCTRVMLTKLFSAVM